MIKYKGFKIEAVSGSQGYYYMINGVKSVVQNWGEAIDALNNAKADIDAGYWD